MPDNRNAPSLLYWEITGACNHNCIHCFNYWRNGDNKEANASGRINPDQLMEIAHKIAEIHPPKVVITGGEPLTIFKIIRPAIDFLLEQKIKISINTNCALLSDEMAKYFCEKKIGLFVSYPSYIPEEFDQIVNRKGAFEQVSSALKTARKYGIKFTTNTVVSKINIASLYDTIKYLKDTYNLEFFCATYVSKPTNASDEFQKIMLEEEELYFYMAECARAREELNVKIRAAGYMSFCSFKDYRTFKQFALKSACSAGRYSIVVTENGDIRACARGDQTYGNVLKEPFHKVWARMSEWKDDSHIPVECKWCPVKKYCRGGCHIDNTNSPKLGKQIAIYSAYERKWKVYFWTQRLLFRRWVIGMYRNIASLYKANRKES